MEIESGEFRMGGAAFARTMVFRYAAVWMLALCATAVAGLALGIAVDLRWFVAGLMIVFVVLPGLLAVFYYTHGLRRECFVNAVNHTLVVSDRGITARIIIPPAKEEEEQQADKEPERRFRDEFFPWADMKCVTRNINSAIVTLRPPLKGFIWIPESAFDDIEVYSDAYQIITDGIGQGNN